MQQLFFGHLLSVSSKVEWLVQTVTIGTLKVRYNNTVQIQARMFTFSFILFFSRPPTLSMSRIAMKRLNLELCFWQYKRWHCWWSLIWLCPKCHVGIKVTFAYLSSEERKLNCQQVGKWPPPYWNRSRISCFEAIYGFKAGSLHGVGNHLQQTYFVQSITRLLRYLRILQKCNMYCL